jgi:hypothetical protein
LVTVGGGAVAPTTITATMKNTGARTSAANDRRRFVALPLRTRRNAKIAGTIANKHSRIPSTAVAGKTANKAPRTTTPNVIAPRRFRGGRGGSGAMGCVASGSRGGSER